ncbi:MAG: MltA domain-containing protein [Cocleimonas sp.]|nr:MltA domain-containing protein [Cocleimonas sp.]
MSNQQLAKFLLCGACLTLFPGHADHINPNANRYGYQTMPLESFNETEDYQSVSSSFSDNNTNTKTIRPWQIRLGLKSAITYLKRSNPNKAVARQGVNVTNQELTDTANILLDWHGDYTPTAMREDFYLQRLYRGNLDKSKFTGYYTPIISAQLHPDNEYRYPIYRSPSMGKSRLSRAKIAAGALRNQGLEVAWTNDPVGLFYVHIQGSGILKLPDGKKIPLKFDGSNDKRFKSVATHMKKKGLIASNPSRHAVKKWLDNHPNKLDTILNINPRFIYFTLNQKNTITASGAPIITGHSVAVDTNYIPFGAVILAEVPIINSRGQAIGNEWRLLFPQDRGNAITGPARMDIYTGIGEAAREKANRLTGYGRAYLLLNKPLPDDAMSV